MPLFTNRKSQSSSAGFVVGSNSSSVTAVNVNSYGLAANTTSTYTSTYKISQEQTLAEDMFARFFPTIKELSQKEPTLSEVNQVYFEFLEYFDRYNSYKQSFEKQKERNLAIFDLIKGNAAIYLIYSKSEDSFISELSKLLIKHIPI